MDIVIDLILFFASFFASGAFGYWIAMREGYCRKKRIVHEGKLEQ